MNSSLVDRYIIEGFEGPLSSDQLSDSSLMWYVHEHFIVRADAIHPASVKRSRVQKLPPRSPVRAVLRVKQPLVEYKRQPGIYTLFDNDKPLYAAAIYRSDDYDRVVQARFASCESLWGVDLPVNDVARQAPEAFLLFNAPDPRDASFGCLPMNLGDNARLVAGADLPAGSRRRRGG